MWLEVSIFLKPKVSSIFLKTLRAKRIGVGSNGAPMGDRRHSNMHPDVRLIGYLGPTLILEFWNCRNEKRNERHVRLIESCPSSLFGTRKIARSVQIFRSFAVDRIVFASCNRLCRWPASIPLFSCRAATGSVFSHTVPSTTRTSAQSLARLFLIDFVVKGLSTQFIDECIAT
jgi:hypothetical protein